MFNLEDIDIKEISLVRMPAVEKATILLRKNKDNEFNELMHSEIIKAKEGKIYFYALVPNELDTQGDIVSQKEIKKAVEKYNENIALKLQKGTGIGVEHKFFDENLGYPILNIWDEDGNYAKAVGIDKDRIIKGAWLTGIQLTEIGKTEFEKNKWTGVSIGGTAIRVPLSKKDSDKDDVTIERNLIDIIKDLPPDVATSAIQNLFLSIL
jgi:hypothetical protein